MNIKYILFVSVFAATISGCCYPIPEGSSYTSTPFNSELIDSIVSDQTIPVSERSIPEELQDIEGSSTVDISFKDDFCACSNRRRPTMSVSSVTKTGLSGYINKPGPGFFRQPIPDYEKVCSLFVEADEAIWDATNSSLNAQYFYLDSFNLILEAEAALEPLECDPVKAKILANEAKLLARTVAAKALGFDITGTYDSEITGKHPIISRHNTLNDQNEHQLILKQDGQKITGVDSSGTALLVGTRKGNVIKFKFSYPQDSNKELEGEWVVDYDGLNVSGSWRDPVSNASGEWILTKLQREHQMEFLAKKKEHFQEFLSRRADIEVNINYEIIKAIVVSEKHINWKGHCAIYGGVGFDFDLEE